MDLLGPTSAGAGTCRRTLAVPVLAVAQVVVAAVGVSAVLGVGADGAAVEQLVVSADERAPELTPLFRAGDDARGPVSSAPGVSTTTATSIVLVAGPPSTPEQLAGTERAMAAYRSAAERIGAEDPGCRLSWGLLAGIGTVESGHGTVHDSSLDGEGKAVPPILGPRLDGGGFALITDTDGGVFDGDVELDRAVGPMQFIPGTWARWGADADGDGVRDPQDVDDAALAAGRYLCASGARLDGPDGLISAVFSYNRSYDYVRLVLTITAGYLGVSPAALGVDQLPAPPPPPLEVLLVAPVEEPVTAAAEPAPAPAPDALADAQPQPSEPPPPAEPTAPPAGEPTPSPSPTGPPQEGEPQPEASPQPTDGQPTPAPSPLPTCPVLPTDPPDPACPPVEEPPAGAEAP